MSKFQISTIQYFTYIARNYLLYLNQVIVKRKKVLFLEKIEPEELNFFHNFTILLILQGFFLEVGAAGDLIQRLTT